MYKQNGFSSISPLNYVTFSEYTLVKCIFYCMIQGRPECAPLWADSYERKEQRGQIENIHFLFPTVPIREVLALSGV